MRLHIAALAQRLCHLRKFICRREEVFLRKGHEMTLWWSTWATESFQAGQFLLTSRLLQGLPVGVMLPRRRWHQLWCHKFKVVRKASAASKLISFSCSLIIGSLWANSANPWHIVTLHCVIAILFNSLARHGPALWLNCLRRQLVQRYIFAANWLVELGWKLAIGSNFKCSSAGKPHSLVQVQPVICSQTQSP